MKECRGREWNVMKGFRYAILIFSISGLIGRLGADLGLPDVQAICRVELTDGTTIEGVILVATGGYITSLDLNGFLLTDGYKEVPVFFKPDFYAIRPWEAVVEGIMEERSLKFHFPDEKEKIEVYFLKNATSKHYPQRTEKREKTFEIDSMKLIDRTYIRHEAIELLPYITVYPRVPDELWLRLEIRSVKPLIIPTRKIRRFQLLWYPSEKWLKQIDEVKRKWMETHDTFEVVYPLWFHEVARNPIEYQSMFYPHRYP